MRDPKKEIKITDEIQVLLDLRAKARKNKDWKQSDELRDKFSHFNLRVEDTADGQKLFHL